MRAAIKHNLLNILNFRGREARASFWKYVLFVALLQMAASVLLSWPLFGGYLSGAFQPPFPPGMVADLAKWHDFEIQVGIATEAATLVLLAAALVRRLHDSGSSGGWAIAAALCHAGAALAAVDRLAKLRNLANGPPSSEGYGYFLVAQNLPNYHVLIALIAYLIVGFFGSRRSTPGPNRHGDMPLAG